MLWNGGESTGISQPTARAVGAVGTTFITGARVLALRRDGAHMVIIKLHLIRLGARARAI